MFLWLNVDLDLNFSNRYGFAFSSFLKCHISQSFLPYSDSVFNFAVSIFISCGNKLQTLRQKGDFSFRELSSWKINNIVTNEFTLQPFSFVYCYIIDITVVMFLFNIRSVPSTTNYLILSFLRLDKITNCRLIVAILRKSTSSINTATLIHCKKGVKILKVWKFRITRCI